MTQELKVWREHLHRILSSPAYLPSHTSFTWIDLLKRWLGDLLNALHIHIHWASLRAIAPEFGWLGVIALLAIFVLLIAQISKNIHLHPTQTKAHTIAHQTPADWLQLAERSIHDGRTKEAAKQLFFAALQRVSDQEAIRVSPDFTNGDYVQELERRHSPFTQAFQMVAHSCDAIWYQDEGAYEQQTIYDLRNTVLSLVQMGRETP